jgi:hypothetical protein
MNRVLRNGFFVLLGLLPACGAGAAEGPLPQVAVAPGPGSLTAAELPSLPSWRRKISDIGPRRLEFQFDLDILAPMGTGERNAALWFARFSKSGGEGLGVWREAERRMVSWSGGRYQWKVLPPDDPFLLETEPWVDQAVCRFYPEVFPVKGPASSIPGLRQLFTLARSWIARGEQQEKPEAAREDFRRVVRLGRLMLQDNLYTIQKDVALTLISMGVEALYEQGRREGDTGLMAAAALAHQDCTVIRLLYGRQEIEAADLSGYDPEGSEDGPVFVLDDERLESLMEIAHSHPDRTIRVESLTPLYLVKHFAAPAQRKTAAALLEALTRDPDPLFAAMARHYHKMERDPDMIRIINLIG